MFERTLPGWYTFALHLLSVQYFAYLQWFTVLFTVYFVLVYYLKHASAIICLSFKFFGIFMDDTPHDSVI